MWSRTSTDCNPAPSNGGSQECVGLVQGELPEIGRTKNWREGAKITQDNPPDLQPGTVIATFVNGQYPQSGTDRHAAVFNGYHRDGNGNIDGIEVVDQWGGGDIWTEYTALLMPSGDSYPLGFSRDIEMDCRYDDGKMEPRRHLTIALPGRPSACRCERPAGQLSLSCETSTDADGTIGPVRMQIAEPISLATQLAGFHLRMDAETIRNQASAEGFAVEEDSLRLHLTKGGETIDIALSKTTRLSRLVTKWISQDHWETNPDVVMRFGVYRELRFTTTPPDQWDRWNNPGQPVIVEYHPARSKLGAPLPPDVRGRLMLIDTEVVE